MLVRYPIDVGLVEDNIGFPCVIKVVTGSYGEGVYLCERKRDYKKLMEFVDNLGAKKTMLVQQYMNHKIGEDLRVLVVGGKVLGAKIRSLHGGDSRVIKGDAAVVALGSYSRPLLAKHGVSLNIYPAKGYSATLNLKRPELASTVSLLDDTRKLAISRLGNQVRIAGTAELSGFDTSLDGSVAKARCAALLRSFLDSQTAG